MSSLLDLFILLFVIIGLCLCLHGPKTFMVYLDSNVLQLDAAYNFSTLQAKVP